MVYYLSNVCFYFLRSSWGRLADGFMKGLNQYFWNFNCVNVFLTPSLSLACILSEVYWVMFSLWCVCVWWWWGGHFRAFSLDTSLEVWKILGCEIHVKTFSLWNFTQSLVVKMRYSAKGVWPTSDPGQCWWHCGVKLLACCLARALVFSAYGCHVLPTSPLESKVSALSLVCVQSYIQNYRSTILQS